MEYSFEKNNNEGALAIKGELNIEQAPDLKATLMESLEAAEKVCVNLEGVSKIDITCIQIFCAANKSCEKKQSRLHNEHLSFEIHDTLIQLGYYNHQESHHGPCARCFWKGAEEIE